MKTILKILTLSFCLIDVNNYLYCQMSAQSAGGGGGSSIAESYRKAAQAYRNAAATTSCPENKQCYLEFANYHDCLAQINNQANCHSPACKPISCPDGGTGTKPINGNPTGSGSQVPNNNAPFNPQVVNQTLQNLNNIENEKNQRLDQLEKGKANFEQNPDILDYSNRIGNANLENEIAKTSNNSNYPKANNTPYSGNDPEYPTENGGGLNHAIQTQMNPQYDKPNDGKVFLGAVYDRSSPNTLVTASDESSIEDKSNTEIADAAKADYAESALHNSPANPGSTEISYPDKNGENPHPGSTEISYPDRNGENPHPGSTEISYPDKNGKNPHPGSTEISYPDKNGENPHPGSTEISYPDKNGENPHPGSTEISYPDKNGENPHPGSTEISYPDKNGENPHPGSTEISYPDKNGENPHPGSTEISYPDKNGENPHPGSTEISYPDKNGENPHPGSTEISYPDKNGENPHPGSTEISYPDKNGENPHPGSTEISYPDKNGENPHPGSTEIPYTNNQSSTNLPSAVTNSAVKTIDPVQSVNNQSNANAPIVVPASTTRIPENENPVNSSGSSDHHEEGAQRNHSEGFVPLPELPLIPEIEKRSSDLHSDKRRAKFAEEQGDEVNKAPGESFRGEDGAQNFSDRFGTNKLIAIIPAPIYNTGVVMVNEGISIVNSPAKFINIGIRATNRYSPYVSRAYHYVSSQPQDEE